MTIETIATHEGTDVREAVLESADARIAVMNYGCVIRDWRVAADGREIPCVLGFPDFAPYPAHSKSFGIVAGRVANRTARGRFTLDGETHQLAVNAAGTHLHGGPEGLGKRIWEMERDGAAVVLRYDSPDGEMGYPGRVLFDVRMWLEGARLIMEMRGVPDRPTPINLAQHNYYNLDGSPTIFDHLLWIAGERYLPTGEGQIPTGEIRPVDGTMLDFRTERPIGGADPDRTGADHNIVLDEARDPAQPAATLRSPKTGLGLRIWTDQPGLQLFTGNTLDVAVPGHDGFDMKPFGGVCLEAQHFPDSANRPEWPSIVCTTELPYVQRLEMEIAPA